MSETRTPRRPISVDYTCDECDAGQMRSTGITLTVSPPIFPHQCDMCGRMDNFRVSYPYIEYVNEGDI